MGSVSRARRTVVIAEEEASQKVALCSRDRPQREREKEKERRSEKREENTGLQQREENRKGAKGEGGPSLVFSSARRRRTSWWAKGGSGGGLDGTKGRRVVASCKYATRVELKRLAQQRRCCSMSTTSLAACLSYSSPSSSSSPPQPPPLPTRAHEFATQMTVHRLVVGGSARCKPDSSSSSSV